MLPIRLETDRFTGGYTPARRGPGWLDANPEPEPLIIETVNLENPIFLHFLNCRTDADFVKFLDRFYDEEQVELDELRKRSAAIRLMLDNSLGSVNLLLAGSEVYSVELLRIEGAKRLVLVATRTNDYMALEIATAWEAGATMTACQHCDRRFLFGPHTGRRSHAKYCSDRCRVAAARLRKATKEPAS
jgi:hypothetical protein